MVKISQVQNEGGPRYFDNYPQGLGPKFNNNVNFTAKDKERERGENERKREGTGEGMSVPSFSHARHSFPC